jgi:hypothetical protein
MTEEEPVAPRSRRRLSTFIFATLGFAVVVGLSFFWAWPLFHTTKAFEEPKLTTVHLDEEPFMRMILGPGQTYRPIELMAGTVVRFNCEVVAVATTPPRFALTAWGKVHEGKDCTFDLTVPAEPGLRADLVVTFYDGGAQKATDALTVPTLVVPPFEGVEFYALEDAKHQPVQPGAASDEAYVYARAIGKLPGDGRDFAALFFTADPTNGVPVLELLPMKEGDKPELMTGSVIRYRSYGADLSGYAFWSPQPVRIGGKSGNRAVTDLYAGIFRRDELPQLLGKLLKVDVTGPDTVTVTPLITDSRELKALTVGGRLLSQSLHLIRGPSAEPTGNEARVPPAPVVAPATAPTTAR